MMQAPREGANPLRPYYVPPSVGPATAPAPSAISSSAKTSGSIASSTFSFPDVDYSDYLPEGAPSAAASARKLLDQAVWKYSSVLMAQPFEVAKLILQVNVVQEDVLDRTRAVRGVDTEKSDDDTVVDSDDEEPNYFTSNAPFDDRSQREPLRGRRGRPPRDDLDDAEPVSSTRRPSDDPDRLLLKNSHSILDALSALSANSGPLSLWRATNSTFVYGVFSRTIETFMRGALAAALGVAEPDVLLSASTSTISNSAILLSSAPLATVLIAAAASAISSLILAPLDAARTRIIITPSSQEPRSLIATIQTLSPAWLIPRHLIPITFLSSTLPAIISTTTPLFFKTYLKLDPVLNPTSWSVATFLGSALDLTVKFPLETILRRAQIATWTAPALMPPSSSSKRKAVKTIVPVPQVYRGVVPTMWNIMREEGFSESATDKAAAAMGKAPRRKRKGQGVAGLYRGWRVGMWGLVGIWGAAFVGGLQPGAEGVPETTSTHGGKF